MTAMRIHADLVIEGSSANVGSSSLSEVKRTTVDLSDMRAVEAFALEIRARCMAGRKQPPDRHTHRFK